MNILVTGAKGFAGRNIVENLKCIRDGKNKTRPALQIDEIFEYDLENTPEELDSFCSKADWICHFAGVNRPKDPAEFKAGNFGFTSTLLDTLKKYNNKSPIMISSSLQATLAGRFGESEYGKSKLAGENLMFSYGAETGAQVFVYRFTNLVGKWVRPNYNSAVSTFCHAVANNLPYSVSNRDNEVELLYIDDLVEGMFDLLEGKEQHCEYEGLTPVPDPNGKYCYIPLTYKVTLGEIVELLKSFAEQPNTLMIPEIPANSFAKKLYSTYLSYLPKEKVFPLFDIFAEGIL